MQDVSPLQPSRKLSRLQSSGKPNTVCIQGINLFEGHMPSIMHLPVHPWHHVGTSQD